MGRYDLDSQEHRLYVRQLRATVDRERKVPDSRGRWRKPSEPENLGVLADVVCSAILEAVGAVPLTDEEFGERRRRRALGESTDVGGARPLHEITDPTFGKAVIE